MQKQPIQGTDLKEADVGVGMPVHLCVFGGSGAGAGGGAREEAATMCSLVASNCEQART